MTYDQWLAKWDLHPEWSGVGDGWVPLLDRLVSDLVAMGWDRNLSQVKEKMAGLRFYVGAGTIAMYERISDAEAESFKVCEVCGKPGKPRGGGWIKTLCDACAEGR